jgi:hypothetical protein
MHQINYHGKPWTFVLRDLAQFSSTIEESVRDMVMTNRTVRNLIGIGTRDQNKFVGI